MSISIDELKLSALPPNTFPGTDSQGVLEDSRVRRVFTDGVVKLSDAGGPYGAEQVLGITLYGVTFENTRNLALVLVIEEVYEDGKTHLSLRKFPYDVSDAVAAASWETDSPPAFPASIPLLEANDSGISGSIVLASAEEDEYIRLGIPLSTTIPVLTGDEEGVISDFSLLGVTPGNSENGKLTWEYHPFEYGFVFLVKHGDVTLASGGATGLFPEQVNLEEVGGSGVSGVLVLSAESGPYGMSGDLVVRLERGVENFGHTEISGDLEISGKASVGGGLSVAGDVTVMNDLVLTDLVGLDNNAPLVVNTSGRISRDSIGYQQVRYQRVFAVDSVYAEPSDTNLIPLLGGKRFRNIPENWWAPGKRINIKAVLAWTRESTDDVNLVVDLLATTNALSVINFVHAAIANSSSELAGEVFLEVNLVVDTVDEDNNIIEVRGSVRMNDACELVSIAGNPIVDDYELRVLASFGSTGYNNSITLKSASLSLCEAPVALSGAAL